jgi:hypothetical protein
MLYVIFDTTNDKTIAIVRTMEEVERYMAANKDLAWQPTW